MDVAELAPGLWRWTARHPDWTPEQGGPDGWEPVVASHYCEASGAVLLIDPLLPPELQERERFWSALDRDLGRAGTPPAVLLTCGWHARSSRDVLERYTRATLHAVEDGVGDLPRGLGATPFEVGEQLPGGAHAVDATIPREVLLWLPSHAALVAGDTLLGDSVGGIRLCPDSWLGGRDRSELRAQLWARVRDLPVERVLVSHGEPVLADGRAVLERALA